MSVHITADSSTLYEQAAVTPRRYLYAATEAIDQAFGEGYARKHPELVGAYINACAQDMLTSVIGAILQQNGSAQVDAIDRLASAVVERN